MVGSGHRRGVAVDCRGGGRRVELCGVVVLVVGAVAEGVHESEPEYHCDQQGSGHRLAHACHHTSTVGIGLPAWG
ncbi:hypothetical protein GCM10009661_60510 [Catellatospora chokoriensis]